MKPVSLTEALASFRDIYSPRIVARVNDYDVKIAHTEGEHVWHAHADTDEFFLVLDGRFDVSLRDGDGQETTVTLNRGDVFVVPRGVATDSAHAFCASAASIVTAPSPIAPERIRPRTTSASVVVASRPPLS